MPAINQRGLRRKKIIERLAGTWIKRAQSVEGQCNQSMSY